MSWFECQECSSVYSRDEVDWFRDEGYEYVPMCPTCYGRCDEVEWAPSLINPDEDISY